MSAELTPKIEKGKYRPEIDGLRAFAVIAVIINHFNKDILPGGYLGVDIFFVISGYVITSSLHGKQSRDFKDFLCGFYARRLKRITPAATIFLIITSVLISCFSDPSIYLKTALSASFGVSNIYLYQSASDYFATSIELNPFAHTWSLGVEEQFYVLFPFLIWFSGFGRQTRDGARNLFLLVGALTIASLIIFLYLYPVNQPAAYFLMTSRFWEMAAGCLIFIGFQKRAPIEQLLERVPPLLFLLLIVGAMYLPMSFAPAATIAVVAISSILIASLKKQTVAFNCLTNSKVVYIGLISYSLYLWHWGVLSISRWTIGIHWWSAPFQVAIMLGLAILSYNFIESPLRNYKLKRLFAIVAGICLMNFSAFVAYILGRPLLGTIYLGGENNPSDSVTSTLTCDVQLDESLNLIVLGDSHAYKLHQAMSNCALDDQIWLAHATRIPFPTVNYTNPYVLKKEESLQRSETRSRSIIERFKRTVGKSGGKTAIIIANRNPIYFYPIASGDALLVPNTYWSKDFSRNLSTEEEVINAWIAQLLAFASQHSDKEIVILLAPPEITTNDFPIAICKREWFRFAIPSFCENGTSLNKAKSYRNSFHDALSRAQNKAKNLHLYDTFKDFCILNSTHCDISDGRELFYLDSNHVSPAGYQIFLSKFIRRINAFN